MNCFNIALASEIDSSLVYLFQILPKFGTGLHLVAPVVVLVLVSLLVKRFMAK